MASCGLLTAFFSYVNKEREITRKFVQHAERRGIKGLFITVDAPQLGRREKVCGMSMFCRAQLTPAIVRICVKSSMRRGRMRWSGITRRLTVPRVRLGRLVCVYLFRLYQSILTLSPVLH